MSTSLKSVLGLAFALLAGFAGGDSARAQSTNCVANAVAGGTPDAITIPMLPCAFTTNLLILTASGANTVATPTLKMGGYPAQNVLDSQGNAPGVGAIPGAGAVILLTPTGTSWKILNTATNTIFSGTLTVPNGGTGVTTIPTNRLVVGQGTGAISTVAAGTTGQVLVGNTGSPPSWSTISSNLVSSFSAGTTGFSPSVATTGAVTLSGTLGVANGGTGLTTGYSNGYLPIGNGSGFTMAPITAGTNVTVTNGSGSIQISASGSTTACGGGSVAGYVLTDNGSNGCTSNSGLRFASNTLTIQGATSGGVGFKVPAIAGTNTLTFPAGTTDFSATGGTSQVVKQTSVGGAFTVARLSCADLSDSGSQCTSSSAGPTPVAVKTASFSASSNAIYCVDTVTGAATVTATLPASPANNDLIMFYACSNYSTYKLTIARNGNNIQGLAQDMDVIQNNVPFGLTFVTSYGWRLN